MQIQKLFFFLFTIFFFLTFVGCSSKKVTVSKHPLPKITEKSIPTIMLFPLQNYTDTPRAGMRASNIVEGILSAEGYKLIYYPSEISRENAAKLAKEKQSNYYMLGAVSEWRYKTGIDGEPAVSFRLALYDTKTDKLIWSGMGSNNDWGNGSIGTTAQTLIEEMFKN